MFAMLRVKLFISSLVLFPLFWKAKAHLKSETFSNHSKQRYDCPYAFCVDHSWPNPEIPRTYPVYGSAIAMDWEHNVIILHRSTSMRKVLNGPEKKGRESSKTDLMLIEDDVIMIIHSFTGEVLRTWGGGRKFARPHGIEVTKDRSVFITDVLLHQVFKYDFNATTGTWNEVASLILGEKFISGSDSSHFCGPADVAVLPTTKDFFVADGYCNSRVIKFSEIGTYVIEFQAGSTNSLSPHIPFNVSHAIRVALLEPSCTSSDSSHNVSESNSMAHDRPAIIFVADRNNARIQSFTENGSFLYEIGYENFAHSKEMLFSFDFVSRACSLINYSAHYYGTLFAVNGHLPRGEAKIFEMAVGYSKYEVLRSFSTSQEFGTPQPTTDDLETPHDICVTRNGESIYIIEAKDELVLKKFVKNPEYNLLTNSIGQRCRANESRILHIAVFIVFLRYFVSWV